MQSLKDSAEAKIVLSLLTPHICNNLEAKVQNIFIKKNLAADFSYLQLKAEVLANCKHLLRKSVKLV